MSDTSGVKPKRSQQAERNRAAIAVAALEIFTQNGFAAARVEDVARRAGVAKGTIYLHFADKAALFEAILGDTILPAVQGLAATEPGADESTRAYAERLLVGLVSHLQKRSGQAVIRLLMAEGPRFPDMAAIYYRTIVEPGLTVLRGLGRRAAARGEPGGAVLEHYPQLAIAPVLMGFLWEGLFDRFEPTDVPAMLRAQLDALFCVSPGS